MNNIPQNQQIQTFLENVYHHYKLPLLRIVYKYTGPCDASEDIFHEVFIRIIKKADMLSGFPQPKLEAYIALIARGVSIDYLRKTYQEAQIDITEDMLLNLLERKEQRKSGSFDPFKRVDLTLMMGNIPAEEQVLLIGKYYLGLSTNDLMEMVGGTSSTIRSKIWRAKKRVFDEWSQKGLNMGDFIDE